jgi:hypothetical protein
MILNALGGVMFVLILCYGWAANGVRMDGARGKRRVRR